MSLKEKLKSGKSRLEGRPTQNQMELVGSGA